MTFPCAACGRPLCNDPAAVNAADWSMAEPRRPYCADRDDCRRDTEAIEL